MNPILVLRKQLGLTQRDLAFIMDRSEQYILRTEHGTVSHLPLLVSKALYDYTIAQEQLEPVAHTLRVNQADLTSLVPLTHQELNPLKPWRTKKAFRDFGEFHNVLSQTYELWRLSERARVTPKLIESAPSFNKLCEVLRVHHYPVKEFVNRGFRNPPTQLSQAVMQTGVNGSVVIAALTRLTRRR